MRLKELICTVSCRILMESGDDLTFKIIFSGDGAGRLRERVKEKLKEFMGDYTDDTLVVCLV
ncbi:putative nuclear polyadenylated RNA-binding protein Nab2/ZC3H14 [Helianthus annuus]|nr:putative nuclear polyadenylated RNA-binding protein Nab2/ZC3H14 [Helianthus annuus]